MSKLPNLSALRAFDAAARQGSFTQAAENLGVTQAAISHQVRKLEEEIGVQLFLRSHKAVTLTQAGRRYAKQVALGFAALSYREPQLPPTHERIVLEVDYLLCRFWLMPLLSQCEIDLSNIALDVRTHSHSTKTFPTDTDIALTRGAQDREGFKRFRLLTPQLIAIVSPHHTVTSFAELGPYPFIHYRSEEDWRLLCKTAQTPYPKNQRGHIFNSPDQVIDATFNGLGIGTAEDILVSADLDAKRLSMISGASLTGRSYYMATRKPRLSTTAAKLADWILEKAKLSEQWQSKSDTERISTQPKP